MSKQAVKALVNAEAFLNRIGVVDVDLVASLNDGKSREVNGKMLWRNAGMLACLIIDSAVNALHGENADTLAANGFADMREAVRAYIASNLDNWSQLEYTAAGHNGDLSLALQRLANEVNAIIERAAHTKPIQADNITNGLYRTEDGTVIAVTCGYFGAGDYPVRGHVVRGKNVMAGMLMCWTAAGQVFDYQCSNFDIVGRVF